MEEELPSGRMRREVDPVTAPVLDFDLANEIAMLHSEEPWQEGRNAKTLAHFDDLRTVLVGLRAGANLPLHATEGRMSIHVLRGNVHIECGGRAMDIETGRLVILDRGVTYSVDAETDATLLLTIAWP